MFLSAIQLLLNSKSKKLFYVIKNEREICYTKIKLQLISYLKNNNYIATNKLAKKWRSTVKVRLAFQFKKIFKLTMG